MPATERNLDNPRGGVSHPIQNDFTESHELQPSESTCGAQSPLLKYSINTNTDNASSHRASLEKDRGYIGCESDLEAIYID
ncbi:hypothetical protein CsSME_00050137 [Camellia sinensis var. sinensis]